MIDPIRRLPLALLLLACAARPAASQSAASLDLCDMKPVFMEEFDRLSAAPHRLGAARWTTHTPWNGDFGDAAFADPGPDGPFTINNGILAITARKGPNGKWRSGLLAAADSTGQGSGTQYGYFETRMRLPPGPGTWPAFWLGTLKPAADTSPGIEIDTIEYYGHAPYAYSSALHVWYKANPKLSRHVVHKTAVPSGSLLDAFHTYGVRVDPQTITYYLDRAPVWQVPTPPELNKPLFPMVNLALGSGFPIDRTPDPSTLLIDYVHVYALDPAGRSGRCPAGAPASAGQ